ncbi:ATP-dependent DNA ligase [Sphingobacterium mizutaii]|uniref:ATP-dependent DNA ligase n=1 Tax=Sphingobacterium mizutaii TaxID=1010 RepID=UPI0028AF4EA6|nr:ATP-dependent DNA ligase [Sphingobacterium mizutaii]
MKVLARLINALDSSNKTNSKILAIEQFLAESTELDKYWFIRLFTGKRPRRSVKTTTMRQLAVEYSGIPEWLFLESYSAVGDLAETIALIIPPAKHTIDKSLDQWMQEIMSLQGMPEDEIKGYIIASWESLGQTERFVFNKLMGSSFRIGVSSKTLINAFAKFYELDSNLVAHSLMSDWDPELLSFEKFIKGEHININLSVPYPFCLANPLVQDLESLGKEQDWQVEYKWDGIRGQVIRRDGEIFIWSRGEELVNEQFPELLEELKDQDIDFVIDGEIVPYNENGVMSFNQLQRRLNRKNISKKMMQEVPIKFIAFDILELNRQDLRNIPLEERRKILEDLLDKLNTEKYLLSEQLDFNNWNSLNTIREASGDKNAEGLMLKAKNSAYQVGRKKGFWWKWKVDPMSIDAVLIYAQRGSGRRSGHYTDYTFAVKDGDKLVTIAKAYSGLSNIEIAEVSKFVRENSLEKFGPVRTVKPELVFEIAFEGIAASNRHKSGVALRFPRIVRWRKDKLPSEIDDIEEIKKLI